MPPGVACVIGLGAMGSGAALSLLRAGITVRGVDPKPEAIERFRSAGGVPADSPAAGATGAAIVFIFVLDAQQTEEVLFGPRGAAAALAPGSVVAACATVPPAFAERLGERLAALGHLLLDAPVSGGAAKAATGEVTVMGSGSAEAFARAEPFLEAIAGKVYRLGETPGIGSRVKMVNQLLAGVHLAVAAEAMALGIKAGADPEQLYEVILDSAGASWMFERRVPQILAGDDSGHASVDLFLKDLAIVLETASALAVPLPIAAAAFRQFAAAKAQARDRGDPAAVIKVYAEQGKFALPRGRGKRQAEALDSDPGARRR